jgi:hypothetical protein
MQIRLPDELHQRAKRIAGERNISLAEVCRRGLELFLNRYADEPTLKRKWELPVVDCGGLRVPLSKLHEIAADDEALRAFRS